jgi:hypothetical protein
LENLAMELRVSDRDWEQLRGWTTAILLGAMNVELGHSRDAAAFGEDLRLMWAEGWFDPTDGLISQAFLERYISEVVAEESSGPAGPPRAPAASAVSMEQLATLLRRRFRHRIATRAG